MIKARLCDLLRDSAITSHRSASSNGLQREADWISLGLHILNSFHVINFPFLREAPPTSYVSSYLLTKSPHQLFILSSWLVVLVDDSCSSIRLTCLLFLFQDLYKPCEPKKNKTNKTPKQNRIQAKLKQSHFYEKEAILKERNHTAV